ncbi:LTA synthase family protein [Helicobacter sp. MIT 14-3879]|uniref:LTA synthase family protein n=1 Tax=Helicobacter sp. MIT 14-3879 TaxID=2040649 RepID=UPI000E1EC43A|nr:alkaline phosphatase family protein [Helicobacter sp. MIT 14-3879]RDU62647.1 hypothetical protein CQA44_06580 [Helicobacter sp. MIT 14-3879]
MITFRKAILSSFIFMILLYVLNLALRILFIIICILEDSMGNTNINEIFKMLYNAFLYDGQIIGVMSIVFFLLNLLIFVFHRAKYLVYIYSFLVIFISVFVVIANIGFYQIYKDVFNAALLGLIFDDRVAILKTAWSGDFGIFNKIILWLIISIVTYLLLFFIIKKISNVKYKKIANTMLFICFSSTCLFAINGRIGFSGISLGKEITPVENLFLRKITMGSFRDLGYVYKGYIRIWNSKFSDYIDESPREAVMKFFKLASSNASINLLGLLEKNVENPNNIEISHIFYIIAESFSKWHFDDEFREIGLMNNLLKLIKEDNAFSAKIFLENAASTIKSLDVQLSGLFQIEIPFNLSVTSNFKTSSGYIFKDLGYKTKFYYGGSGTWQKLDTYVTSQGFDEILYNTHIISYLKRKNIRLPYENSWGVYDNFLYDFVIDNTPKDKTFSMILTTSYHSPYDVPLDSLDIPFDKIDFFIANNPKIIKKDEAKRVFSHIIYQDKMIYKFIKETSKKFPNSLFVITGDHYDRMYPFSNASINVSNQIPFIVYSPKLRPKVKSNIGSHIDIIPTIVELIAPNGYKYASFGTPMLSNSKVSINKSYALGYFAVADKYGVYNEDNINSFENKRYLLDDLKRAKAISWYIFKNGYEIRE